MSWAEYEILTKEIPIGGDKTGKVRGLNLDDLSALLQDHLEPISKAVAAYSQHKQSSFTTANMSEFVLTLAKDFPSLVSEVISIAAEEPSLRHKPVALGIQISALSAIVSLTLEEAGGLGNLSATLAALVKGALQNASEQLPKQTRSRGSIGE